MFITAKDATLGADCMVRAQGIKLRKQFKAMLLRQINARREREMTRDGEALTDEIRVRVLSTSGALIGHMHYTMADLAS